MTGTRTRTRTLTRTRTAHQTAPLLARAVRSVRSRVDRWPATRCVAPREPCAFSLADTAVVPELRRMLDLPSPRRRSHAEAAAGAEPA